MDVNLLTLLQQGGRFINSNRSLRNRRLGMGYFGSEMNMYSPETSPRPAQYCSRRNKSGGRSNVMLYGPNMPGPPIYDFSDVKCCICLKLPAPPLFVCINKDKHYLCSDCHNIKIDSCPYACAGVSTCKMKIILLDSREYENFYMKERHPCPFAADGCNEMSLGYELSQHKSSCYFRPFHECILSYCKKRIGTTKYLEHVMNHGVCQVSPNKDNKFAVLVKSDVDDDRMFRAARVVPVMFNCYDLHFILVIANQGTTLAVWIALVEVIQKFEYFAEITLKHRSQEELNESWTGSVHHVTEKSESIIQRKDVFFILKSHLKAEFLNSYNNDFDLEVVIHKNGCKQTEDISPGAFEVMSDVPVTVTGTTITDLSSDNDYSAEPYILRPINPVFVSESYIPVPDTTDTNIATLNSSTQPFVKPMGPGFVSTSEFTLTNAKSFSYTNDVSTDSSTSVPQFLPGCERSSLGKSNLKVKNMREVGALLKEMVVTENGTKSGDFQSSQIGVRAKTVVPETERKNKGGFQRNKYEVPLEAKLKVEGEIEGKKSLQQKLSSHAKSRLKKAMKCAVYSQEPSKIQIPKVKNFENISAAAASNRPVEAPLNFFAPSFKFNPITTEIDPKYCEDNILRFTKYSVKDQPVSQHNKQFLRVDGACFEQEDSNSDEDTVQQRPIFSPLFVPLDTSEPLENQRRYISASSTY